MTGYRPPTLAGRLKALREEHEMAQKDVAQYIGVSERVYSYYEDGRFPKNEDILIKLSLCYGVTVDYLLGKSNLQAGGDDNVLRSTGLDDKSLSVLGNRIKDKDVLNSLIQHDNFPLLVNLLSLYSTTDAYRLLSHINNEDEKFGLNEREKLLLSAYNDTQIKESDKENNRLIPSLSVETVQYLRIITQHEPIEPFLLSILDNCLNRIVADIKMSSNIDRTFPINRRSSKGGVDDGGGQATDE